MAARFDEKEFGVGEGKTWRRIAANFLRENYKAEAPYAEGERKVRIIPDYAHDKHTTSGHQLTIVSV